MFVKKQLWDDRKEKLAAAAEQQRLQQEAFTQQQQQYAHGARRTAKTFGNRTRMAKS